MANVEKIRSRGKAVEHRSTPSTMSPWDAMERWFDEFGRRGWPQLFNREWPGQMEGMMPFTGNVPKVDVLDRENEVVVKAELPGVEKDDLEVTVTDHSVTIRAQTKHEEKEEEGEYYRREMSYGEYQRTLELPETVDDSEAKATFSNGVLELTLPKMEKTPRRTVRVD